MLIQGRMQNALLHRLRASARRSNERLTHSGGEVCIAAVEVHDYLDASVLDRSRQPVNRGDATGPQVEQTLGS